MAAKSKYSEDATGIHIEVEHDNDPVNHPSHYTDGNIEVKDYIRDKDFNFFLGNVIKYVSRAGKKYKDKQIEDLKKARWYLEEEIFAQIRSDTESEKFVLKEFLKVSPSKEILVRWHKTPKDILEIRGTKTAVKSMLDRELIETKTWITVQDIPDPARPGETIIQIDLNA